MAKRWFNRPEPKEIWDEPLAWPIGDIEAAQRIRDICRAAAVIARAGALDVGNRQRCERASRVAMEIAMKIGDDLLRDSAVRQIIDLCLITDNPRTAKILFRAIQASSIREEMLLDHPQLEE